ncbi:MAG: hypothetical protein MRY64_04975 [Hyphomonadaceae bacterium]|nr:hypothetical protein [Hyphomonadaceae bacterium]
MNTNWSVVLFQLTSHQSPLAPNPNDYRRALLLKSTTDDISESMSCRLVTDSVQIAVGIAMRTPLLKRWSRPLQSALADHAGQLAKAELSGAGQAASGSRTHCRGLSAAAFASSPIEIGLDVEWLDPHRNWLDILAVFIPSVAQLEPSPCNLVRGWVFLEAFYKAEQRYPSEDEIFEVMRQPLVFDTSLRLRHGASAYFSQLPQDMMLGLYWRGGHGEAEITLLMCPDGDSARLPGGGSA